MDHLVIFILSLLILQVIFTGSRSSLDLDHHGTSSLDLDHLSIWIIMRHHHWIWIITGYHHWILIITRSGSSLLDHHHWIFIITQSGSSLAIITRSQSSLDLDHPWCYLMILLVTGSSTEPALFHARYRPSLHVGLLQHLYLTLSHNGPPNIYI